MTHDLLGRRSFLAGLAALSVAGLVGCNASAGGGSGSEASPTGSATFSYTDARGNFAAVTTVGTLRTREWTSREVREIALPRARDERAVPAAVVDLIAGARRSLRRAMRPRAVDEGRPLGLILNLLPGGIGTRPDDVPVGEHLRPALVMVHRGPASGPHCTVVAARGIHVVSVLDDSGILDVTRLAEAFAHERRSLAEPT